MSVGINKKNSSFPYTYELLAWLLYAGLYKYAYYVGLARAGNALKENFPHPQLIVYAIALTLYTIPFYKWLGPTLLKTKKYTLFVISLILYFGLAVKIGNWVVGNVFHSFNPANSLSSFFLSQKNEYTIQATHLLGWDLKILFTDIVVFLSVIFVRYAFETERKKYLLEKENLALQFETLKARLNPHFLFNTLNSIYSMSLMQLKETPEYILKLSDMMRFILYDCEKNKVPLEKEIIFLQDYFDMEKKRYPDTDIKFTVTGELAGKEIAPLLFIQFVENSFKHGSHRINNNNGYVHGKLDVKGNTVLFTIKNDIFTYSKKETEQGGVGINSVNKRLALYYPGKYDLKINTDNGVYNVSLAIQIF